MIDDRTVEIESVATAGSESYTYPDRVSLAREGPWDTEQFEAATDGETTLSGSFTVSVTNADETASANGAANTGIEG